MTWATKRASASSSERARRSQFEVVFEKQLKVLGLEYVYEKEPTYFTPPSKVRRKTFDWHITLRSGKQIIIETKGWWQTKDRIAELEAIKQNPHLDIRYVFQRANAKIRKGSKTSYADVCRKHGVLFSEGVIDPRWLDE